MTTLVINPFHATALCLYLLKISKNLWLFYVFRGYRKRPIAWNHCVKIARTRTFSGPYFFPHSDWIWIDTEYLSVFGPNVAKYGPEKLRIRIHFMQWWVEELLRNWCCWGIGVAFWDIASGRTILWKSNEQEWTR